MATLLKVLHADDDENDCIFLANAFSARPMPSYSVSLACALDEGKFLHFIKRSTYDIVIMDYNYTPRRGDKVMRDARAAGLIPERQFSVLLSGADEHHLLQPLERIVPSLFSCFFKKGTHAESWTRIARTILEKYSAHVSSLQ